MNPAKENNNNNNTIKHFVIVELCVFYISIKMESVVNKCFCGKEYKHLKDLRVHVKKSHSELDVNAIAPLKSKMPPTQVDSSNESNDLIHVLVFNSFSEFEEWKQKLEKDTVAQFFKNKTYCSKTGAVHHYYECHRSGFYKSEGQGKRSLKMKGSSKINGICPASIKVVVQNDVCTVHFNSHHTHECSPDYLHLTSEEKLHLAEQISRNIPFKSILDKVRDSVTQNKLDRIHPIANKNLRRRVTKFHPNKLDELAPKLTDGVQVQIPCSECPATFENKAALSVHLQVEHSVKCVVESISLPSMDAFEKWKLEIEQTTVSKFVKERGSLKIVQGTKHYYVCHRRGYFVSKGTDKRTLKTQGSSKMNAICPAYMRVTELSSGVCSVEFMSTHVGHGQTLEDLAHLTLSDAEKKQVAESVAHGVPFSTVLKNIRDSMSDGVPQRIHLLNRTDLDNIVKQFGLNYVNKNKAKKNKAESDEDLEMPSVAISDENEAGNIVSMKNKGDVATKLQQLQERWTTALNSVTDMEGAKVLESHMDSIEATLGALKSAKSPLVPQKEENNCKSQFELQGRLYSTKKAKSSRESSIGVATGGHMSPQLLQPQVYIQPCTLESTNCESVEIFPYNDTNQCISLNL
uniref:C2H2-type domain-containing protein n=1 Tax=Cacopsylla melanoneura TaxID=428564 RepID=A0A8D8PT47_9HEMI